MVRVLLPGVIVYPVVVNCRPRALIFVPRVTVPAVPAKTAVSPEVVFVAQVCALVPFHHKALDVSHVPVPPSVPSPVEVQERDAADAGKEVTATANAATTALTARCCTANREEEILFMRGMVGYLIGVDAIPRGSLCLNFGGVR
jgi:hypothetical protein